jgi:glutamyl-Q tRNA(Asp) synthetase
VVGGFERLTWLEEGEHPGLCRATPARLGDAVLGRKDIGAGYLIASVLDDALQGVTHVIRGVDLVEATSVQRVIQALLGLPTPVYRHHRLLLGPDGRRLSKRDSAEALAAIRARGVPAHALRTDLGFA